ncbi:MAG: ABC transporter substrate-binding protein [Chloroflexaceae bacterium]
MTNAQRNRTLLEEGPGGFSLSRRLFLRGIVSVSTAAGLNALLAACGASPPAAAPTAPSAPTTAASARSKTLVFAAESLGESLEPGLWNGFGSSNVLDTVYDRLTRPGLNWTDPPRPALAESWEISADGLTYTFKLRPGVKFHDGTELNADAVVRSLTRMVNSNDPSYVEGMYMNAEYGQANWERITALDPMTVELVLKSPDAAQLYRLFHPAAAIMSVKAMDELRTGVGTQPVGAGPFRLERFVPGQEAVLVAFDDYWDGGRPPLDRVIIRAYSDEGAMLAAMEAGEVNFAPYPPSAAIERLRNDSRFVVEAGPPIVTIFLAANRRQAPLDNRDIRLAINYAIDREAIIEGVFYGLGELPATLVSPAEPGFDPAGREISRKDQDKAREHIAKSGLSTPIPITLSYEANRFWPLMAELVKSDLEAVGFQVTLDRLEAGAFSTKVFSGLAQINLGQRSLWVPDPDNKVRLLHSSQGTAQFETGVAGTPWGDEMDKLIDEARSESDQARRIELYKIIQQKILEEMPYITLAYYNKPYVVARGVRVQPASAVASERIFLHQVAIEG